MQREETLSETEKHWNQVILAFLAIGTTVLGVTLVVYGRSDETPSQENLFRLIQAVATVLALAIYLGAFLYTVRTIFPPLAPGGPPRIAQKRLMASTVIALFTLLAVMAAAVIFIEIVSPDSSSSETLVAEEPINGDQPQDAKEKLTDPGPLDTKQVTATELPVTPAPPPTLKGQPFERGNPP